MPAGPPERITGQVLALRERRGSGRLTVLEPHREAFAPVAERLRGL
ncbi:hypothetical protein AB0M97_15740 [Streptomyces sp. NPDC051207]